MSLKNMSTALSGVYWADLTVFTTAPTCKPDLNINLKKNLSNIPVNSTTYF
jgi:hypothetical protein